MTGVTEGGRRRGRGWPEAVAAGLAVAAALAAGVLVWGRVADTPTAAMLLTVAWFAVVFVVAGLLVRRRRWLLLLVRLESFEVQPGPDYYVHVVDGADMHRPATDSQVARLRGTSGNQNYPLAAGRQVALPATVLIWCRTFDTPIAAATIR